jgi:putative ABC transport system ATP-binding protein
MPAEPPPRRHDGPALELDAVTRRFGAGERAVDVLDGLDLIVRAGERVAVTGASGSGKSTLLHLAAGMDRPDAGHVVLLGRRLDTLGEPDLTRYRAESVGLVFQDFNLIDSLTARENIELPLWLTGRSDRREAVEGIGKRLGVSALLDRRPAEMSGGEKQRIAIARALVHRPGVLLADEPTGSLDEGTAASVLELFDEAVRDSGCALVLVTHNPEAAAVCDRQLSLHGGRLREH